jgi:hypothetical protein
MRRILLPVVATLALAGCGGHEPPPEPESSAAAPDAPSSAFRPLTDTLDRAASVEDTLRDAAAERRRQLEAQE